MGGRARHDGRYVRWEYTSCTPSELKRSVRRTYLHTDRGSRRGGEVQFVVLFAAGRTRRRGLADRRSGSIPTLRAGPQSSTSSAPKRRFSVFGFEVLGFRFSGFQVFGGLRRCVVCCPHVPPIPGLLACLLACSSFGKLEC